ncbi:DnaA inactivator Hda [Pseudaeromonas paramecii]|uniref:DnaA inactivator Hda n=1 Tax=Pseudaeromonas paramecii TaxID=2138166 RepID=A0ABP8Q4T6_9GAMM
MSEHHPAQLSLAVQLPDDETFASFYPGENAQLITTLKNAAIGQGAPLLFFWGTGGSGRSHLLHATCAEVNATGEAALYIPLEQHERFDPRILEEMEQLPLVCLDNLDAIAGHRLWEESLFDFFNRWKENNRGSLIVTADTAPRKLGLCLPDLASRLDWGLAFQLHELDDEGKLGALQLRAALRGFKLPVDAGRFLLNRLSRDMRTLLQSLDELDKASLHAKRKLTIPFIKEILGL